MNINSVSNEKCVGCGICSSVCPTHAIVVTLDKDGFLSPILDKEKCIDCSKCVKYCLKYNSVNTGLLNESSLYYGFAKDDAIRDRSSSGGIGYVLSCWAYDKGYDVWGVIYDKKTNTARHIKAQSREELELFQGSKYIQSDMHDLNEYLVAYSGEKALIFGTPCQIEAIRLKAKYFEKHNLLLVDVFCRGVPTYHLWNNYLKDFLGFRQPQKVSFREKKYGWHKCQMIIEDSMHIYTQPASNDMYYKLYGSALCFRDSCYNCDRKLNKVFSDIRIGDFWGDRFLADEKGVSLIFGVTSKGKEILNELNNVIELSQDVIFRDVEVAQKYIYNVYNKTKIKKMRRALNDNTPLQKVYDSIVRPPYFYRLLVAIYQLIPRNIQIKLKSCLKNEKN